MRMVHLVMVVVEMLMMVLVLHVHQCDAMGGGCTTDGRWIELSMEERLIKAQVVVYGRDERHVESDERGQKDSMFTVYCVLKPPESGNLPPRNITISRIAPRDCSATYMQPGEDIIIGLKRLGSGDYAYHEVSAMQTVAFAATTDTMERTMRVCGFETPRPPRGGLHVNDSAMCPRVSSQVRCTSQSVGLHGLSRHQIVITGCFWSLIFRHYI